MDLKAIEPESKSITMRAAVFVTTYNGLAAGPFVSCCIDFLLDEAPNLGAAIDVIELYPHCDTSDPIPPTQSGMVERFESRLQTLPIVRVYRRYRRAFVSYRSAWTHSSAFFGREISHPDLLTFNANTGEMADALDLLRTKFKASDDFDVSAFRSHLRKRMTALPGSVADLERLQAKYLRAREIAGQQFRHI